MNLVDFLEIVVLASQSGCCLLSMRLDVVLPYELSYFGLVFGMRNLVDNLLQFGDEPICMSFWVLFARAQSIGNIVFIVLHEPHTIIGLELLPLFNLELH
jgi:hypothetical protein